MDYIIKDILNKNLSQEAKIKALAELKDDIELAENILSGEWEYCEVCDDYYIAKSFLHRTETKVGQVCVYRDPINSGGNEYQTGYIDTVYKMCPKGHAKIYRQDERLMLD